MRPHHKTSSFILCACNNGHRKTVYQNTPKCPKLHLRWDGFTWLQIYIYIKQAVSDFRECFTNTPLEWLTKQPVLDLGVSNFRGHLRKCPLKIWNKLFHETIHVGGVSDFRGHFRYMDWLTICHPMVFHYNLFGFIKSTKQCPKSVTISSLSAFPYWTSKQLHPFLWMPVIRFYPLATSMNW